MAFNTSRALCVLGRPVALGRGTRGSRKDHSSSERSLWYAFLMLGIVPSKYLNTPFQTVSRNCLRSPWDTRNVASTRHRSGSVALFWVPKHRPNPRLERYSTPFQTVSLGNRVNKAGLLRNRSLV